MLTRTVTPNAANIVTFDHPLPVATPEGETYNYDLRVNGSKRGLDYTRDTEAPNRLMFDARLFGEAEVEIPMYIIMEGADREELLNSTDTLEFEAYYTNALDTFTPLQKMTVTVGFNELADPDKPVLLHFSGYFTDPDTWYDVMVTQKSGTALGWKYQLEKLTLDFFTVKDGKAVISPVVDHSLTFTNTKLGDPVSIDLKADHVIKVMP